MQLIIKHQNTYIISEFNHYLIIITYVTTLYYILYKAQAILAQALSSAQPVAQRLSRGPRAREVPLHCTTRFEDNENNSLRFCFRYQELLHTVPISNCFRPRA